MPRTPNVTRETVDSLIRIATVEGKICCGFIFRADPFELTVFGNCPDMADIRVYEKLCMLVKRQEEAGMLVKDDVKLES